MKNKQQGQSILEVVFAIGLISLVTGGVTLLILTTLQNRSKEIDRKKMVEMSELIIENVIDKKINEPASFWNSNSSFWQSYQNSKTLPDNNFQYFYYSANISQDTRPGCGLSTWECVNVVVNIGDSRTGNNQTFNRFFSRQ